MVRRIAYIPSAVPYEVAVTRLSRAAQTWFRRKPTFPNGAASPQVELIWLPFYRIDLSVNSRKGLGSMTTLIDAWSGALTLIGFDLKPVTGEPDGQRFAPHLDEPRAVKLAQRGVQHAVMRQRSLGPKPTVGDAINVNLIHCPFWIFYFERRAGLLDVKILDAVNGKIAGAKTRAGILAAFKHYDSGNASK